MHQLLALMRAAEQYQLARHRDTAIALDTVTVHISELKLRANSLNIYDIKPFFSSHVFKSYGMSLNERDGVIIKSFK